MIYFNVIIVFATMHKKQPRIKFPRRYFFVYTDAMGDRTLIIKVSICRFDVTKIASFLKNIAKMTYFDIMNVVCIINCNNRGYYHNSSMMFISHPLHKERAALSWKIPIQNRSVFAIYLSFPYHLYYLLFLIAHTISQKGTEVQREKQNAVK